MKLLNKLKDKVKSMLPKKDSLSVAGINIPIIPFNLNRPKHKTVPAPQVLKDDEWFGPAVISDSNKDYMREKQKHSKQMHLTTTIQVKNQKTFIKRCMK